MNPSIIKQNPQTIDRTTIGVGTFKVSQRATKYVNNVLRSERLSYGPYTKEFEKVFALAHDCRFAIMTNSGTSSLMIALYALKLRYGWKDGDEVLVPSVTFVATANVVLQLNMKPVFVDVDPVYYEMNPELLEKALTKRTRCIMPVHLFGSPCEMDKIQAFAEKHDLRILEDSCETMFTKYKGKSVGSMGDIGCFSTYVAHLLCTGVGGLCTTNDPQLAINLRSIANHGRDSIYLCIDDDNNKTTEEMRMIINKRFSFTQLGYSFRPTEMEGALGLAEFEEHEPMMKQRWENAQLMIKQMEEFREWIQLPTVRPDSGHAFMMFPLVLRNERKQGIVEYLEKHGIETRDMLPLVNQPVYRKLLNIQEKNYPVAKWVNENGFYIGCHQSIGASEIEYMVDTLRGYFQKRPVKQTKSCLIVMSKVKHTIDPVLLQARAEALKVNGFDEYFIAESSGDPKVGAIFSEQGFTAISSHKGKGALLKRIIKESTSNFFVTIGIDGSDDPADISKILVKLKQGYELVIASRFMPGGSREAGRFLSYRSLGNRFFNFLLGVIFRRNVTDCNNLLRGFTRQSLEQITTISDGDSIAYEITAGVLEKGLGFTEIPTAERKPILSHQKSNRFLMSFRLLKITFKFIFGHQTPRE